jgi:peptidoglycan/LPS O-acetylase OafA/YrhL
VWSVFYLATGLGHQAVMAFFVLSGFLVGGTVVSRAECGQWSWIDYAITRMTRLWMVLLPALLLTAFWDNLGIGITRSSFYDGGMDGANCEADGGSGWQRRIARTTTSTPFIGSSRVPRFPS